MKKMGKKGVSIVEAVVAMAVMTIVIVSAISTMELVSDSSINDIVYDQARLTASNALECFKYADNSSEFKAAFTPYEGVVFDKTDNNQGYIQYWYSSKTYNMKITVNYESADGSGGGVFAATAHDKNNKVMFNISYNKG